MEMTNETEKSKPCSRTLFEVKHIKLLLGKAGNNEEIIESLITIAQHYYATG
jgi:hypothetical protein